MPQRGRGEQAGDASKHKANPEKQVQRERSGAASGGAALKYPAMAGDGTVVHACATSAKFRHSDPP